MEEKTNPLNILFISATIPYPTIDGGRIRVQSLINNLCQSNKVTFLTFIASSKDEDGIDKLRNSGIEVIGVKWNYNKRLSNFPVLLYQIINGKPLTVAKYYSPKMLKEIKILLNERHFDVIHFEMLHTGQYLLSLSKSHHAKTILDQQNIDSLIWQRLLETEHNPIKKLAYYWQYRSFSNFERKICPDFDTCVCVSEEDRKRLFQICPKANTDIAPNGVDLEYFVPSEKEEKDNILVFTGSMDWQPNEDAVLFFCEHIFPLIKAEIPEIEFYIVGSKPTEKVMKLNNIEGVIVTGFVDDVRSYISNSTVYIVPLRIGGGTRLKILQAFAMSKAVVSTSIGCEGIDVNDGQNILISDEPRQFAENVIKLLKDKQLRCKLGENGRKLVQQKYDWKAIAKKLESIYR
ncbi:TPA: glycosyltransferase [bacterium]|nr:glycosyltransferase [bacterium]